MRVAAIQLTAELGHMAANIARSERLVDDAARTGAQWIILPEFFPTAVAYHPSLQNAAQPLDGPALQMMSAAARRHRAHVGGSFICARNGDRFNTFVLVRPDGSFATHDKDVPTMWEACYYTGGHDDGVVDSELGPVGIAVCWELLRYRTARRLRGRIRMLVSGTCWASGSDDPIFRALYPRFDDENHAKIAAAPGRMARLLGVPVVHASQAGNFRARIPIIRAPYRSFFLGETQIVDGNGAVLARRSRADGEGVISADIDPTPVPPGDPLRDDFWIGDLPRGMGWMWTVLNAHGRLTYRRLKQRGVYP